jgi:hypothetical protein
LTQAKIFQRCSSSEIFMRDCVAVQVLPSKCCRRRAAAKHGVQNRSVQNRSVQNRGVEQL